MALINCPECGNEIKGETNCTNCGCPLKGPGSFKVKCYAYYCGWESEAAEDFETANSITKCPRCGIARGSKLKLENA